MIKNRKGQVTIFVIIAIIIVAAIIGFFLLRSKLNLNSSIFPVELNPQINKIQSCVQSTLQDGTKLAGLQGGYILPPSNALETNFSYIAWGYYLGQNTLASKTKIENEISKYMELTLPFCFDVSAFPNYKISTSNPQATIKINENYVSTSVSFPFTVTKGQSTWKVDKKYLAEYNVKLGNMYSTAQTIIAKEAQNPNSFDMSYLSNFNYDISILNQGNNIIVYSIKDYKLNQTEGYTFRFANRIK